MQILLHRNKTRGKLSTCAAFSVITEEPDGRRLNNPGYLPRTDCLLHLLKGWISPRPHGPGLFFAQALQGAHTARPQGAPETTPYDVAPAFSTCAGTPQLLP